MNSNSRWIATAALMCAIISVVAPLSIPTGTVPFSMQTLVISLVAALFPFRISFLSTLGYIFLIAIGLPIAAEWNGGFHLLLLSVEGKTGGFIWSFLLIPVVFSLIKIVPIKSMTIKILVAGFISALMTSFIGTTWFYFAVMSEWDTNLKEVVGWTVTPFVAITMIKIIIVTMLYKPLSKEIKRVNLW